MSTYEADPTRFCTPATELVFALALAGLSGAECSVMLAAIGHCFGPPRWEVKGTLLRVSRHWLAGVLPHARSTTYAAIDNLVRRGLLRTAANKCLIINKRLHEWRDGNGAPLFGPQTAASANMHTHLAKWPWFVELANKVPLGAGPLFLSPPEAQDPARASGVPSGETSGPPDYTSGQSDYRRDAISGPPDYQNGETSGPPDANVRPTGLVTPETPPNEAARAAKEKEMAGDLVVQPDTPTLDCDRLVTYAATEGRLDPAERPKLAAMLATCLAQGVDPSTLVAAVEDYAANETPETLRSALAYIRSRINAPRKIVGKPRRSYAQWCAQRPATPAPRVVTKQNAQEAAREAQRAKQQQQAEAKRHAEQQRQLQAQQDCAAAFTARPAREQIAAIDELRRGGDSLAAVRLEAWRAQGAAPWRNMAESQRKSWQKALAAGETVCRGVLREIFNPSPTVETVAVKNPEA